MKWFNISDLIGATAVTYGGTTGFGGPNRANYVSVNINLLSELDNVELLAARVLAATWNADGYHFVYFGTELNGEAELKRRAVETMLAVEKVLSTKGAKVEAVIDTPTLQTTPEDHLITKPADLWEVTCQSQVEWATGAEWIHHRVGIFEDAGDAWDEFEKLRTECEKEPPYYRNPRVERVKITPKKTK